MQTGDTFLRAKECDQVTLFQTKIEQQQGVITSTVVAPICLGGKI